jgi:hypothetical protein
LAINAVSRSASQQVNVAIPLTRASAIVGRIYDEYGEPVTPPGHGAAVDDGGPATVSRARWRIRHDG